MEVLESLKAISFGRDLVFPADEQGWPHEHIGLQFAHQERDDTSAAYNYALYLEPRARMMQAWGDYLDRLRISPP